MAILSSTGTKWVTAAVTLTLVLASLSFALTPASGETLRPVDFDDTVSMGGTGVDTRRAEAEGFALPRAQVFYSGYRYVVGYVGVETVVSELGDASAQRQFGDPLAVYVSDFSDITPNLTEEGYVVPERGRAVGWTPAESAYFVVGSEAAIPSGSVILPFSERSDAEQFAEQYGGDVVDWAALQSRVGDPLPSRLDRFEASIDARHEWANETVTETAERRDRPRSVVVDADSSATDGSAIDASATGDVATAATIADAIAAAPPNTTVYLPPGTYDVDDVVVNKSITLAGAGPETVINGDGNRSVVFLKGDGSAVRDLRVTGVGDVGSRGRDFRNGSVDWDTTVQLAYGYGDAAIVLDGAAGASVANVEIDTSASGVIVRESPDSALTNLTVRGAATAREGFMGVVLIGARSVVQDSVFIDGRDGVYTHRADGSVVRDNRADPGRYGVHEMYTSESLVANNTVRNAQAGVIVMTRPTDNIIVGNDVRQSTYGIVPAGGDSYYARNVVVDNERGLQVAGDRNTFAENVVIGNEIGVRASDILPSNWVLRNDFVDNEQTVESTIGPLRTWSHSGVGNHWGALPIPDGNDDGIYDRPYRPSGSVDSRIGTVSGATALAQSPAVATLRRVQDAVSGLRQSGVVDTHARTEPFHPEVIAAARAVDTEGFLAEERSTNDSATTDETMMTRPVDERRIEVESNRDVTAQEATA
ncbi:NosD domain-containing protein [Halobellus inordinatus]|uniref:NosD domain-containing protein n=1 Tax=Halobellus inordinatus TaxID=1126236 RepID=UPI00210A45BE|nr:NosD domain-containing protein [Halobellus inordinatus]